MVVMAPDRVPIACDPGGKLVRKKFIPIVQMPCSAVWVLIQIFVS